MVLVETGDFTGQQPVTASLRGHFHLEVLRKQGYDAITLGDGDAPLGADFVRVLAVDPSLPLVSANIRDAKGGALLFPATRIVEKKGLRVGITAVTTSAAQPESGLAALGLTLADPIDALAEVLPKLRKECAVTIVVARMTLARARELADRFPNQIDVMLVGGSGELRGDSGPENGGALFVTHSDRGQTLGRARLTFDAKQEIAAAAADDVTLFKDLPESKEIATLVEDFQKNVNEILKEDAVKNVQRFASNDGSYYVGAGKCGDCHQQEHEIWAETRHSSAFNTLILAASENLPECYRCHVTGSGESAGYAPGTEEAKDLVDVQCEVCHGKGSHHSRDGNYGARLAMNACVTCHDPHNSPDFDPEVYWLMIEHGSRKER